MIDLLGNQFKRGIVKEEAKGRSKPNRCNAIDTHCKALMDNETTAKEAARWHWNIAYRERVVCGVVIELIILSLHVSRSMAAILVIDNARGRVNKKCVACLVAYRTTTLAYKLNTETKKFQLTREYRQTALSGELKIVKGINIIIFFSLNLTQAEKVKAYLINGAKRLPGFTEWPNPELGWGALCVKDSIPNM